MPAGLLLRAVLAERTGFEPAEAVNLARFPTTANGNRTHIYSKKRLKMVVFSYFHVSFLVSNLSITLSIWRNSYSVRICS